jgi:hypothetical protein
LIEDAIIFLPCFLHASGQLSRLEDLKRFYNLRKRFGINCCVRSLTSKSPKESCLAKPRDYNHRPPLKPSIPCATVYKNSIKTPLFSPK